jgi:hypothetical protein
VWSLSEVEVWSLSEVEVWSLSEVEAWSLSEVEVQPLVELYWELGIRDRDQSSSEMDESVSSLSPGW